MGTCDQCSDLRSLITIRSWQDVQSVMRIVQRKLADGFLIEDEFRPEGQLKITGNPFSAISIDGPCPDFLQHYFRCVGCGQLFALEVETYHGTGGTWQPL